MAVNDSNKPTLYWAALATIVASLSLGAVSTVHAADAEEIFGALGALFELWGVIILVVLVLEWFFLPFAIFGTKTKLDKMIAVSEKTNGLLEEILDEVASAGSSDEFERHRPFNSRGES